MLSTKYKINSD